jgi:polysaccharide export outer membrane protein
MVERQLKLPRAGVAGAIGAMVFCAIAAAVLGGCAEMPGAGPTFTPQANAPQEQEQEQAPAAGNAELEHAANKYLSASTPGNVGYLTGPQDVLDITVFKAPELTKTVQVAEDGTINLPLLGQIPAAGKSPSELERMIQTRLDTRYMKSSQVTVFVKEYNSQRVTVEGAVKSPGVLPLRGNDTLMQVIAKSGGLDRETASSNVVVFRTADGARTATKFDVSAIKSGAEQDPRIFAGDVVVVDDSFAKVGLNTVLKVLPLAGTAAFLY